MSDSHRSIYWRDNDARLKTYKAETRARGGAVVKIELEVSDPCRLGYLLQELAEIKRDQGRVEVEATIVPDDEPQTSARRVSTNARGQMLIAHRIPVKP
ncbi:hypothetical protein [Ferrovibrio sp.]|uniref:hypothetical protein n=1 Tax=Ferrovibrio sp. TaxID=1917215 RepID=UPI0035AECBB0